MPKGIYDRKRSPKAERRLKRELANIQQAANVLETIKSVFTELVRTANSNPVLGLGLGTILVDILYRSRVIGPGAVAGFYGLLLAETSEDILGAITKVLPFTSQSSNAVQPAAVNPTYATGVPFSAVAGRVGATKEE